MRHLMLLAVCSAVSAVHAAIAKYTKRTLFAALLVCTSVAGSARAADHTNVIIVYADDLGWGDLACYGHPEFETPNLDRLAAQGARLTNFQSSCPYCAPSRASLMTGRYQFRSGMTRNPCPDRGIDDIGIPAREITLGEAFRQAGYATCCVGKWHLGHKPEFHPLHHGFDDYLGILYSNDMHPVELWDNDKVIEYPVIQATLTRRYTERSLKFIERNRDKPFFLYLPHAMPHKPLAASEEFYRRTGESKDLYADVVREVDWSVGQIVAKLRELGLEKQTLLWFTSDNGPWYGGSTNGLRGMKGRTWEGGVRVPLIASWPGHIPSGHVSHEPAIIMDLYVTSLRAAGLPVPDDRVIDGRDIMPLLTSDAPSPHEALFSFKAETLCSVRSGRWKYHVSRPGPVHEKRWKPDEKWLDPRRPDGLRIIAPCEQTHPSQFPGLMTGDPVKETALFDLKNDPAEQKNVAETHPEVVERLSQTASDMQRQLTEALQSKAP